MSQEDKVRQHLQQLQYNLQQLALWQTSPPEQERLQSEQPFHLDTLEPYEWLQWIFIPRMHALLDAEAPLPSKIAITPYLEEAMNDIAQLELLLSPLTDIESLLNEPA
ncbi:YqcC family protein [Testudinibacter sp. TR-2022]|uniref:YqcC family protein n=1 Tax=Testudinibacter sp. TR-2022 TaxID=2585029 RepID=UPI001117F018|nr:YqcC family protein [Testudinibacter sp. TR-2022]TNH07559.1 anhydro-N-acetylmuramic acid kinase [Pasteurellaceae bacterium Phil11]TNH24047.1 anhydro-N-acetylmuramic acid kinase [Testudinibacter sp. TR-2022]TNH24079.1 anhydro-N-acetylmuramic acid kinase [Testudinibacter sp. TR-2022]